MNELKILPIELVDEPNPNPIEEKKISSSTGRIRLLGTLLRPVEPNTNIPKKPYVIGLTGRTVIARFPPKQVEICFVFRWNCEREVRRGHSTPGIGCFNHRL